MKSRTIYVLAFIFGTLFVSGQKFPEKGVPFIQNFSPEQYFNKGKIWGISSSENGIVYMVADGGLLEYDGKTWNSFIGSKGITRSLLVYNDSIIYTGSDLDFGIWKKNIYQAFEYTSLYPFQKEVDQFYEEFWNVHQMGDDILFVSHQNIYIYKNQQLTRISAPFQFTGSFKVNDSLYFADEKNGLYLFEGFSLKQLFKYPEYKNLEIAGVYHNKQGIVLVTKNSGLYQFSLGELSPLNNSLSEKLKPAKVFSFEQIGQSHLSLGTVLNGLYIADLEGNIIHHINKNKGLPNSTILSLHYSNSGKLWIGMDYGISSLNLKNNITYIIDYRGNFGTGYTSIIKDDVFYLGTNQGLYWSNWNDLNDDAEMNRFQLVRGSEGQVWTLQNIDGEILIGHDQGLFALKDNTIQKLNDQHGVWTILPYKDYLLTGNYNGISIFKKDGKSWVFVKKMDLIFGSCNQLVIEKDNILWVNIPNYGIIRATLDINLNPIDRLFFSDSAFEGANLYLTKNKNEIQVITDQFEYIFNENAKVFEIKDEKSIKNKVEGLLSGVYQARPLHSDYTFYPTYNGFALNYINESEPVDILIPNLVFRKIEAFNNNEKILFHPIASIPFSHNNIRIESLIPNSDDILYQFKLNEKGNWSSWSSNNTFEFINLNQGKYTLFVRGSANGKSSEIQELTFFIAAPWYRTWSAYIIYILSLILLVFLLRFWQNLSLKKQKSSLLIKEQHLLRQLAEKHNYEIMVLEQERIKAEYEQLKETIKLKTIELANKSKENEDKNRLLILLKEKCDLAQKDPCTTKVRWGEVKRLLDSYLIVEDKTFEIQMDELHQEFFKKLKENFQMLSGNDLRICAYLKIGLNSKEIADILNIQPSSLYISRSRLRKKLNLKTDEDLYNFLNDFNEVI